MSRGMSLPNTLQKTLRNRFLSSELIFDIRALEKNVICEFYSKIDKIHQKLVILTQNIVKKTKFPKNRVFKNLCKKSETELETIVPRNEPTEYISKNP